ncbi:MAG: hypothetical protein GX971_14800, partial [Firmicutes bacterium]|nr:hypothetical protein [Bacillota bacterium]
EVPKDGENALVEITDLAKGGKYKKEAKVTLTAKYTEYWKGEKIVWSADDKAIEKINTTPIPSDEEENDFVGQKLEFVLGKKDVKITGEVVTPKP